jgi:hypothetical protein
VLLSLAHEVSNLVMMLKLTIGVDQPGITKGQIEHQSDAKFAVFK